MKNEPKGMVWSKCAIWSHKKLKYHLRSKELSPPSFIWRKRNKKDQKNFQDYRKVYNLFFHPFPSISKAIFHIKLVMRIIFNNLMTVEEFY